MTKASYDSTKTFLGFAPSDVTDKVFVAVDKIRDDYEMTKARDLDTR